MPNGITKTSHEQHKCAQVSSPDYSYGTFYKEQTLIICKALTRENAKQVEALFCNELNDDMLTRLVHYIKVRIVRVYFQV